jgi:hypothetical protein
MRFKVKPGVTWKSFPKGILIEPDIALNGTASQMFNRLIEGRSYEEIKLELSGSYAVPEDVLLEDLTRLIEDLTDYGVLEAQ